MTAGLISTVDGRRDYGRSHGFQLLGSHQSGGVLRADDVDIYTDIGTSVQSLSLGNANRVLVEDLFNRGEPLAFVRDFL